MDLSGHPRSHIAREGKLLSQDRLHHHVATPASVFPLNRWAASKLGLALECFEKKHIEAPRAANLAATLYRIVVSFQAGLMHAHFVIRHVAAMTPIVDRRLHLDDKTGIVLKQAEVEIDIFAECQGLIEPAILIEGLVSEH